MCVRSSGDVRVRVIRARVCDCIPLPRVRSAQHTKLAMTHAWLCGGGYVCLDTTTTTTTIFRRLQRTTLSMSLRQCLHALYRTSIHHRMFHSVALFVPLLWKSNILLFTVLRFSCLCVLSGCLLLFCVFLKALECLAPQFHSMFSDDDHVWLNHCFCSEQQRQAPLALSLHT